MAGERVQRAALALIKSRPGEISVRLCVLTLAGRYCDEIEHAGLAGSPHYRSCGDIPITKIQQVLAVLLRAGVVARDGRGHLLPRTT